MHRPPHSRTEKPREVSTHSLTHSSPSPTLSQSFRVRAGIAFVTSQRERTRPHPQKQAGGEGFSILLFFAGGGCQQRAKSAITGNLERFSCVDCKYVLFLKKKKKRIKGLETYLHTLRYLRYHSISLLMQCKMSRIEGLPPCRLLNHKGNQCECWQISPTHCQLKGFKAKATLI